MKKVVLKNGLTVLYYPKKSNSVVVEVMINVGSCHEKSEERGISHFLEHILFEGTTKRATNKEISNEIERIGGDFNAYTSTGKTCFYAKVLKKHFTIAVDVLADILQNPLLREEDIKKEKNVIIDSHMSHFLPKKYVGLCIVTKCKIPELKLRMKKRGYKIIGTSGWKPLRGELAGVKFWPEYFWIFISDITQFIVRKFPQYAYTMLCTKDKS